MKPDFFALLILGHLVGDFVLQNKWMALNKSGKWYPCLIHCLMYSGTVGLFTSPYTSGIWYWPFVVFATHFPVDYFSLADKWLDFINGRSLRDFIKNGKDNIPKEMDYENYHALRAGFTAVVYAVTDNTIHLALMYGAAMYLLK